MVRVIELGQGAQIGVEAKGDSETDLSLYVLFSLFKSYSLCCNFHFNSYFYILFSQLFHDKFLGPLEKSFPLTESDWDHLIHPPPESFSLLHNIWATKHLASYSTTQVIGILVIMSRICFSVILIFRVIVIYLHIFSVSLSLLSCGLQNQDMSRSSQICLNSLICFCSIESEQSTIS